MEIINHYSMLWIGIIILGLVAFVLLRKGFKSKDVIKLAVLAVVLLIAWLLLRPQQASTTEIAQFQAQLDQGLSVLLEMQSPY
jgi:phosphoglycerol transferase MdoB-like AlkP superfamily enzyme